MSPLRHLLTTLSLLMLGVLPGRAQDTPPAGGWPLREVPVLTAAPQPPGGLVPYRQGPRWGYADTTGRLVIAPVLGDAVGIYGFFRPSGFGYLGAWVLPRGRAKSKARIVLNARGEFLRVRSTEFVAADAAGRLRVLPRRAARRHAELRPALLRWEQSQTERRYPLDLVVRAIVDQEDGRWWPSTAGQALGGGRFAHAHRLMRRPLRTYWRGDRCGGGTYRSVYRYRKLALTDSTGRHLGGHRFSALTAFHERRGWYRLSGRVSDDPRYHGPKDRRYGLLDDRGRQLTPALFDEHSPFNRGYATVRVRHPEATPKAPRWQYGVLDSLGRFSLPLRDEPLSMVDGAGLVRRLHRPPSGPPVVQVLNGRGEPAFPDYEFEDVGACWGGRAWVRQGGRQGLIDARGRWVVPCQYEALRYPRPHQALGQDHRRCNEELDYAWPPVHYCPGGPSAAPDTSYLLARRNRLYGVVARHSGREVVPCRYDSVLTFYAGYGSFRRGGVTYFVDPRGRELLPGYFAGQTYDFPQGRFFVVYQTDPYSGSPERLSTVVDSTGRQLLPWLRGLSQYLPDGRALVQDYAANGSAWTVVDAAGRVQYRTDAWLSYLGDATGRGQGRPGAAPASPAGFVERRDERRTPNLVHMQLLDANFVPVLRRDFGSVVVLAGGWLLGSRLDHNQQPYAATLIRPDGHCYELPPDPNWHLLTASPDQEAGRPPFYLRGAVRTTRGYVTQGGRQLWQDEETR